jgi:isocitrate/isopropylmalate dehydrogenase
VLDRCGRPVTAVVATDVIVRENNIDRAVVQVDRAPDRFDIAVGENCESWRRGSTTSTA